MTKAGKIMTIGRCRFCGIEEQGLWALLLVAVVIQIACAFGALRDGMTDSPQVATAHLQDATLLSKR